MSNAAAFPKPEMQAIHHRRFVYDKPPTVYWVARRQARPSTLPADDLPMFRRMEFLTAPYHRESGLVENVLVTFAHREHAEGICAALTPPRTQAEQAFVLPQRSEDADYFADVANAPLVVILGGTCDLETQEAEYDLAWHSPRQTLGPRFRRGQPPPDRRLDRRRRNRRR
jgi:hypothetical protein